MIMENDGQQNICHTLSRPDMYQQGGRQFPIAISTAFDKILAQSPICSLASKIYEEGHLRLPAKDLIPNLRHLDVNELTPLKPSSSHHSSHFQQQIPPKAQLWTARDKSYGVDLGRTSPMDTILYGVPEDTLTRAGHHEMKKGANPTLLQGWTLPGVDQIPPRMSYPVLNSLLPEPNKQQRFQTSRTHHQQDFLSHVIAKTPGKQTSPFRGSTNNLNKMMLPINDISGTNGRMMVPERQTEEKQMLVTKKQNIGRQKVPMRQRGEQKMMVTVRQIAEQKQKDQLTQQQENGRKRKNLSNLQAEQDTLDGGDADVEKPLDVDIETFLSHDDDISDIMSTTFNNLHQRSTACSINEQNGFSFKEVGSLNSSNDKILCCHFSSDGKLLASAGHGKKVSLWSVDKFDSVETREEHSQLITDVRFRPSSSIFATSSFDKTVQLWDANKPSKPLFKLFGHAEQVNSLDFHPTKLDILSSCDSNNQIRLWNLPQCACTHIFEGATRQVRFQPRAGKLLAAASGNVINLFDVEHNTIEYYLKGHVKEVRSMCWDTSGKYIASVSEDSARVWSVVSDGKCIYELHSNGNKFESCIFHPGYSQLLVIGSYQSFDLWNPTEKNKIMTVPNAHNGIIAALAECSQTEMMASASHDRYVKLWR